MEKVRSVQPGQSSGSGSTFLRNTTRLDPLTYVLFGAYEAKMGERGLECDEWLPIQSHSTSMLSALALLKAQLDDCMLRVFDGISNANAQRLQARMTLSRKFTYASRSTLSADQAMNMEDKEVDEESSTKATPLSSEEIMELDFLTRDIVQALDMYSEERMSSQSRRNSRPATPFSVRESPSSGNVPLPSVGGAGGGSSFAAGMRQLLGGDNFPGGSGIRSGDRTPYRMSRPQTPLREMHSSRP